MYHCDVCGYRLVPPTPIVVDDWVIAQDMITYLGEPLKIRPKAYRVGYEIAVGRGSPVSKEALIVNNFGDSVELPENNLAVHMSRLKHSLPKPFPIGRVSVGKWNFIGNFVDFPEVTHTTCPYCMSPIRRNTPINIGDYVIYNDRATKNGVVISLSPQEVSVLFILAERVGRIVRWESILIHLGTATRRKNIVAVYINRLRTKLPDLNIETIRGEGLRLTNK